MLRSPIVAAVASSSTGRSRAACQPPPHCFVYGDQILRNAPLANDQSLLLTEQRTLRIEHALEIDQPLTVLQVGDVKRAARGFHRIAQDVDLQATVGKGRSSVVELASGAQHDVLVLLV